MDIEILHEDIIKVVIQNGHCTTSKNHQFFLKQNSSIYTFKLFIFMYRFPVERNWQQSLKCRVKRVYSCGKGVLLQEILRIPCESF